MQVAGIRKVGGPVELIDVSEPRPLAPDEVLVEVAAAGVGDWDEFVRTGRWDVGGGPPTALGGEAAGKGLAEGAAAGVGDWDEFVRTGRWDVGGGPPTALGVEAAGTVLAVGDAVADWSPGDEVMTHPLPLRDQGTWAPQLIAPAALLARKPANVTWEAAAAFPIPALTAEQVIGEALDVHAGEWFLVHGAG